MVPWRSAGLVGLVSGGGHWRLWATGLHVPARELCRYLVRRMVQPAAAHRPPGKGTTRGGGDRVSRVVKASGLILLDRYRVETLDPTKIVGPQIGTSCEPEPERERCKTRGYQGAVPEPQGAGLGFCVCGKRIAGALHHA